MQSDIRHEEGGEKLSEVYVHLICIWSAPYVPILESRTEKNDLSKADTEIKLIRAFCSAKIAIFPRLVMEDE